MSALDDLIDVKVDVNIEAPEQRERKALPAGKARATLVEYAASRDVVAEGDIKVIMPAVFLVEGAPYNEEVGIPSLKIRKDVWVAMEVKDGKNVYSTEKYPEGHKRAGRDKNEDMARFFKAFGRSTQGTSWNDLIGSDCTLGFAPEVDNRDGKLTGFLKGTWVGKAD
jgi:hypothetical protein